MANHIVIIDGTRYALSPADSELLRQIKSRSSIAKDIEYEALTGSVVKRLIGHTNVIYYNLETRTWNSDRYVPRGDFSVNIRGFKTAMRFDPIVPQKYQLVAPVIMTINNHPDYKFAQLIHNPKYSEGGATAVGNVIIRNKSIKQCELFGKSWVYVDKFWFNDLLRLYGMKRFLQLVSLSPETRTALLAAHMR